mgnify:CR=1 FL=1
MRKFKYLFASIAVVLVLAMALTILPTGTKAEAEQTATVVYTVGSVEAEGSIHLEDFGDFMSAMRAKNRQWKADN